MSKGIQNIHIVRQGSEVVMSDAQPYGFVYETSLVKSEKWFCGDRLVLPDGREYKYAKSTAALLSGQGCEFSAVGYTVYTAFAVSAAIGDTGVTVPAATHAALTKDELRGGYIIVFNGTNNNVQFRGITGNDAAAANALFKVYLDGPLVAAVVAATSACETYQNPYAALAAGASVSLAKAGVPASAVAAANTYFWVQTDGFCWVAPQAGLVGKQIGAMWRHDGSLDTVTNGVTVSAFVTSQYAGNIIEGSATGNGPLFYLRG